MPTAQVAKMRSVPALVLLSTLGFYLASGLRTLKMSTAFPIPAENSTQELSSPMPCIDISGEYSYYEWTLASGTWTKQTSTATQSECRGTFSVDPASDYLVEENIITVTSGPHTGSVGVINGLSTFTISWDDGTTFRATSKSGRGATLAESFTDAKNCKGESSSVPCKDISGQYTSSFRQQTLTATQSECRGTFSGDESFEYLVKEDFITVTSGSHMGSAGVINGEHSFTISWFDGTFYSILSNTAGLAGKGKEKAGTSGSSLALSEPSVATLAETKFEHSLT